MSCHQCQTGPTVPILTVSDVVILDYIFVDHTKLDVKVKTKVVEKEPKSIEDVPLSHASVCDIDVEQEPRVDRLSELILKPVTLYNDPFRGHPHKIVLCEMMRDLTTPVGINSRHKLTVSVPDIKGFEPLVGFEQGYVISGEFRKLRGAFPRRYSYHDSVGAMAAVHVGRSLAEEHMVACITAGIHFCGMNREKAESQWEYQLGPSSPVTIADDLVVSRYLLERIAEMRDVTVTFEPAPEISSFTSALHLNFSTREMRENHGLECIKRIVHRYSKLQQEELLASFDRRGGKDNAKRLVGCSSRPSSSSGISVGDKQSALRIPGLVNLQGQGYFEERRPSSDADPYTLLRVFISVFRQTPIRGTI